MFTKTTGLFIVPVWILATAWLVSHDVWPRWTAKQPPAVVPTEWLTGDGRLSQYTIEDEFGRAGTVWTDYLIDEKSIQRNDLIFIERLPSMLAAFAPLRVKVESSYTASGILDEITIRLETQQADVLLHGERFHSDFSFKLETGTIERTFKIPLTSAGLITGAFNPFGSLSELHVGQSWTMQVVNPIASLTGIGDAFIPLLVQVTGEERLTVADGDRNCLVVEAGGAKAWVDARGAVLKQEMTLPMFGQLTILRDTRYEPNKQTAARNAVISGRRTRTP